ncbi:endonuclease Q family protein [Oceanobacillus kapialis]|uniref:Endonuclease Q family protein n=1 Tax=Oceanobacillus kapialis TaxID=481353 RepID=A0ABW5Q5A9_9BACI
MDHYFVDMHIHIGRDMDNKPVKITGAKSLTLTNVLKESSRNKGMGMIGVIDCHVPAVQHEINTLIKFGKAKELDGGGIRFEEVTLLLGSEIEIYDVSSQGPIHVLCFLPDLQRMAQFTEWLTQRMTNINLSSQRYYGTGKELQYRVKELDGIFVPAHVFTPFKSLYGKGVRKSLTEVFDPDLIDGIELGLSSDTTMADNLAELHAYPFLTNSDAHSLAKIAREYQAVKMDTPSFKEFLWALHGVEGRGITANYGMNPALGKYHLTICNECNQHTPADSIKCIHCGSTKITKGVADRIQELSDGEKNKKSRPPYFYQVPLEYIPYLGKKTYEKLLQKFNNEMNVIHKASQVEMEEVIPSKIAKSIIQMREGKLSIQAGGGGKYGKVISNDTGPL